jgi:DNA polymerase-4
VSRRIAERLLFFSPSVEPARYGHFFVDMSGTGKLFGRAVDCAARMNRTVSEDMSLPGVLGIARNKLVSSIAAKVMSPGLEVCDVPPGSETEFLAPLRVHLLPSVSSVEGVLVDDLNVRVVRELASIELGLLARLFGRRGSTLYREARGVDESPVRPPKTEPSILVEENLADETNDDRALLSTLYRLTEDAVLALRKRRVVAGALALYIRYTDQYSTSRTVVLDRPTNRQAPLFSSVEKLFFKICVRRQCVRYISIEFTRFTPADTQMNLFPLEDGDREDSANRAMEAIREKYGLSAIACGRTL